MTSNDFTSINVFCALDVGKAEHHGTALLGDGRTVFDKPLPNGEPALRQLFARLQRKGKVLVVVDQPASIGTLGCGRLRLLRPVSEATRTHCCSDVGWCLLPGQTVTGVPSIADACCTEPGTVKGAALGRARQVKPS